jgi:SAM-dependent methyltransferase
MESIAFVEPFVAALLGRFLRANGVMLDVGCGPAGYRSVTPGRYVGIDITDRIYAPAGRRGLDAAAAADHLPFAEGSFDLLMSKSAFFMMPDHKATLQEFRRVLKPGGRVLLVDYNARTQKKLGRAEGKLWPCWSQWRLRDLVGSCGFRDCEILPALTREMGALERRVRPLLQEFFGTWAVVTGIKG